MPLATSASPVAGNYFLLLPVAIATAASPIAGNYFLLLPIASQVVLCILIKARSGSLCDACGVLLKCSTQALSKVSYFSLGS